VVITTAGRIKTEMLTLDSPSISIKDVNVITSDTCKVVCYTINLYSPSRLCEFVAIPNVSEHDTVTTIEFSDHARRATVTYYYVVPRNNDSEHFDIKFFLKDNEEGKNVAELTHSL
jgi:UDP-galactopyranose mutase